MAPSKTPQPRPEILEKGGPGTQKAAVLDAPFKVRLAFAKMPDAGPGEVRVKIHYVGICGSDIEAYRGTRSPDFISVPARLGHEVAGVIDDVGKGVVGLQMGDHVCLRNVSGAFAEYLVCKPISVQVVPKELPLIEASLFEILPSAIHAAEIGEISPSKNVLIMGQGVSGLIMTQIITRYNPRALVVTDLFDRKLRLAQNFGATHTYKIPAINTPTMDVIKKDFPDGFDVVIPCRLEGDAMVDAIDACAQNGRIVMYGAIGKCTKPIDFFKMHRKRVDIFSTEPKRDIDNLRFLEEGIRLVTSGLINTRDIITHVIEIEDIDHAFQLRDKPDNDVIHVVIACNRQDMFPRR
jgi:threonine dehydrogenase-like Zn-dependent dehydrogenase